MTEQTAGRLTARQIAALREAAERDGGWGLFKLASVKVLAERGFFTKEPHPFYGPQWRITDAGRAALAAAPQPERDGEAV